MRVEEIEVVRHGSWMEPVSYGCQKLMRHFVGADNSNTWHHVYILFFGVDGDVDTSAGQRCHPELLAQCKGICIYCSMANIPFWNDPCLRTCCEWFGTELSMQLKIKSRDMMMMTNAQCLGDINGGLREYDDVEPKIEDDNQSEGAVDYFCVIVITGGLFKNENTLLHNSPPAMVLVNYLVGRRGEMRIKYDWDSRRNNAAPIDDAMLVCCVKVSPNRLFDLFIGILSPGVHAEISRKKMLNIIDRDNPVLYIWRLYDYEQFWNYELFRSYLNWLSVEERYNVRQQNQKALCECEKLRTDICAANSVDSDDVDYF